MAAASAGVRDREVAGASVRAARVERGRDIPALTGLRCIAAAWVLLHHASFLPVTGYRDWIEPVAPVLSAGTLGVDLFFVLSGMVLARAYLERWQGAPGVREVATFVWGRLARVWPLYAVVVGLFGVWCLARAALGSDGVVTWQHDQPGLDAVSWLSQLTMTQLWTSPGIEGVSFVLPTWSVSAEWLAYLVFPLIAAVGWRLRSWPLPVLATAAALVATPAALAAVNGAVEGLWFLRIAGGFTAGVLTWLAVRRITVTPTVSRRAHLVVVAVLVELLVLVYWAATAPGTADVPADARLFLAVPLFPVLLGALTLTDRGLARGLAHPRLQHGGRISYALYLVHFPLMEIAMVVMTRFEAFAPGSAAAGLLVPHVVLAAVVVAHLAHRLIEEPARVWMQGLVHRRSPAVLRTTGGDAPVQDPSRRRGSARRDDMEARRDAVLRRVVGRRGGSRVVRPGPGGCAERAAGVTQERPRGGRCGGRTAGDRRLGAGRRYEPSASWPRREVPVPSPRTSPIGMLRRLSPRPPRAPAWA